jgi:hypothetical protein
MVVEFFCGTWSSVRFFLLVVTGVASSKDNKLKENLLENLSLKR